MKYRNERVQWEAAVDSDDFTAARAVLVKHPELLTDTELAAHLLFYAARKGKIGALATLVELGIDVNLPLSEYRPDSALWVAATAHCHDPAKALETVRWLIGHGARVNFAFKHNPPYCYPLLQAIQNNDLEMVKVMVSTGEDLNLLGGKINQTALSWALDHGCTEIAEYLRSRGALESHQVLGLMPTAPPDPDLA